MIRTILLLSLLPLAGFAAKQPTYKVSLQKRPTQIAMVYRSTVKRKNLTKTLGSELSRVYQYVLANKGQVSGPPFTRFVKFTKDEVVVEAGVPIAKSFPGNGEVEPVEIPSGDMAITSHFGSYQGIEKADEAIKKWMASNKKKQAGSPIYYYVSDPISTKPENVETQIFYPVQ